MTTSNFNDISRISILVDTLVFHISRNPQLITIMALISTEFSLSRILVITSEFVLHYLEVYIGCI